MALSLLDGTSAAVDFTIATISYKCIANYLSIDFVRDMFEYTTFCTAGGWRTRTPGMKQGIGRLDGFAAKGVTTIVDPLALFSGSAGSAFVFTVDTGCTLTGTLVVTRDHTGMRAAANSERGIDFETQGAVTSVWVTA
jgi:hypothetical protein